MTASTDRVPSYSWYALALLTTVYILNFLDRVLIYTLFPLIKKELAFSDFQLAILGTTSFAIFYTAFGIPFGLLADRFSRKVIIGIGLAVWSLFSGLTGFADTFWTIFGCRLMVGIGEATLGPAALSLLSDYFPPRMRATVQSVYSSAITIGAGLAAFLGAWIGAAYGWRWAFYTLGFPGLLLAVLVFGLREQPRGGTETPEAMSGSGNWSRIFRSPALLFLYLGYALVGLASNNIPVWMTIFFTRVHHLPLPFVGRIAAIIAIAVGIPAMVLGGYFSDRWSRVFGGSRLGFTASTAVLSVPLWIAMLFLDNAGLALAINAVLYALAILWVGPATADVHDIAGPHLRGFAIGIFFAAVNFFSYIVGAPLVGRISDALGVATNPEQMRYSLLVCPAACALGALCLWMGSRARKRATASAA